MKQYMAKILSRNGQNLIKDSDKRILNFLEFSIVPSLVMQPCGLLLKNAHFQEYSNKFKTRDLITHALNNNLKSTSVTQICDDGVSYDIEYRAEIHDENLFLSVGSMRKTIEKVQIESKVDDSGKYDPLTGLLARNELFKVFDGLETRQSLYMFLLDIDYFKSVNDQFGHIVGDKTLKHVASRLVELVGDKGVVSRLGGEEFCILRFCENVVDAKCFAKKINETFNGEDDPDAEYVARTVSVGVCDAEKDNYDVVLDYADKALLEAKNNGRNRYEFFDKSLRLGITYKGGFITEAEIEEAFDQGGFSFEGQAVVDLNTQKTVMTEMFMRWKHKGAVINAEDFIKKINVVSRNPKYKQKLSKLRREYTNKEAPGVVSYNVDVSELLASNDMQEFIDQFASSKQVTQGALMIELNHAQISNRVHKFKLVKRIRILKAMGVKICVDNFGEDNLDLESLFDVQFDVVKFSAKAGKINEGVLSMLVHWCEMNDKMIIATKVDDYKVSDLLQKKYNINYQQGYRVFNERVVKLSNFYAA